MREGGASHPAYEHETNIYTCRSVDTSKDVVATMRSVITTQSEQLALVTISLIFGQEGRMSALRQELVDQSTHHYLHNLRRLVRRTDEVLLAENTFYFVLLGANLQGGAIVQERLWEALLWRIHSLTEREILRPRSASIGYSAYPFPYTDIQQCLIAACEPHNTFGTTSDKTSPKDTLSRGDRELSTLARKLGIPYLALLPRTLPTRVRQLISPQLAQELHCFPLGRERDTLTVAIADPEDQQALDRLGRETGLRIFPVLVPSRELRTVLKQLI
jgi:hypothetical protein